MRSTILSVLFSLFVVVFCGAQNDPPAVQEEPVSSAAPGTEMSSRQAVRSLHHMAWVEKQGNLRIVVVDGRQQGGHYNDVAFLQFSPDEAHFVFATKSGEMWSLVRDGKDHPERYFSIGGMVWQPIGGALAFTACPEKKKCRLYVNNQPIGPEYEAIYFPQYSKDGMHLAYMGWRNKGYHPVLDGKETGTSMDLDLSYWGFSPAGHFYVAACRGHVMDRQHPRNNVYCRYVVDGEEGPEFKAISPIEFSRDGKHFTYGGLTITGRWTSEFKGSVLLDGKVQATYGGKGRSKMNISGVRDLVPRIFGISNPVFTPGGKLAYAALRESGDVAVFVGDEAGQGFKEIISPIIFSPDAQHFAYVAQQDDTLVEVHDNHPGATFQPPGRLGACHVGWIYVTNDPEHHLVYELVCGGIRFQALLTNRALRRIVVDGKAGPEYDVNRLEGFRHTADWKHYGYEVHGVDGNHALMNIDGKESKVYDDVVVGSLEFQPGSGTASFIAREAEKLVQVKWPIQ